MLERIACDPVCPIFRSSLTIGIIIFAIDGESPIDRIFDICNGTKCTIDIAASSTLLDELDYELVLGQLLELLPFASHSFLTSLRVMSDGIAKG